MSGFAVELDLTSRVVTAVGGTPETSRLVRDVAAAGATVRWFATTVASQTDPPIPLISDRAFTEADLDDGWLAIAGSEDPEANRQVTGAASRRRMFCLQAGHALADRDGTGARRPSATDVRPRSVAEPERPAGSVALVGGGPGDPDLITVRGRRLLRAADVVLVDRLAPRGLLAELAERVEIIDCGKSPHGHNMSQDEINRNLVQRAVEGKRVVRLKGGDPFVFGRGGEEYLACRAAGIPVQVVPGVSSVLAAPALADIPLTHRGVAADFVVIAGHLDPSRPDPEVDWAHFGQGKTTLVILMGMERLAAMCSALVQGGRRPDTPAAVVHRASTPDQRVLRAPLAELAEAARNAGLGAPSVVVIGDVVDVLNPDRADR